MKSLKKKTGIDLIFRFELLMAYHGYTYFRLFIKINDFILEHDTISDIFVERTGSMLLSWIKGQLTNKQEILKSFVKMIDEMKRNCNLPAPYDCENNYSNCFTDR